MLELDCRFNDVTGDIASRAEHARGRPAASQKSTPPRGRRKSVRLAIDPHCTGANSASAGNVRQSQNRAPSEKSVATNEALDPVRIMGFASAVSRRRPPNRAVLRQFPPSPTH
jgi:hypothetical protein